VVRTVAGPTAKGTHRVAWDLCYPDLAAERDGEPDKETSGVQAMPGAYTVELAKRVDGVVTPLAGPMAFEVVRLRERGQPGMDDQELGAFLAEVRGLQLESSAFGAALDEAAGRVAAIRAALERADGGRPELYAEAVALKKQLDDMKERLRGDPRRGRLRGGGPVAVNDRLGFGQATVGGATYGPTRMHREQLDIGVAQLAELQAELATIVGESLPDLETKLDAAGVPWTPSRGR